MRDARGRLRGVCAPTSPALGHAVAGDAVDVLLEAMLRVVRGPRDECDRLGGGWRCEGLKLKGRAAEAIRVPGYVSADGE